MLEARKAGAPLVHEHWGDNLFLTSAIDVDFEAVKAKAARSVTRELRTSRQVMSPIEGRGVVANWHSRLGQLVVHTSTQQPHIVRSGLAECLGIDEGQIRVVAPDVGGGFGYKGILLPEEVALAWATRKLGVAAQMDRGPAREPHRQRQLPRAPLHPDRLRRRRRPAAGARLRGDRRFRRLLGLSLLGLPGRRARSARSCRASTTSRTTAAAPISVATNKPPILPYRGVARTGVCFALEVTLDALAREIGIEPNELRFKSLVRPEQMPFDNIAKRHFDSGDYPEALRRAIEAIGFDKVRARQQRGEPDGRRIGIGFAMYSEQAGHGTSVYAAWGIPFVPGHEPCAGPLHARRRAGAAGSARTATARAWRPRCRRWRTPSSACRTSASGSCTATPPRRPTPRAPGARAA